VLVLVDPKEAKALLDDPRCAGDERVQKSRANVRIPGRPEHPLARS